MAWFLIGCGVGMVMAEAITKLARWLARRWCK